MFTIIEFRFHNVPEERIHFHSTTYMLQPHDYYYIHLHRISVQLHVDRNSENAYFECKIRQMVIRIRDTFAKHHQLNDI